MVVRDEHLHIGRKVERLAVGDQLLLRGQSVDGGVDEEFARVHILCFATGHRDKASWTTFPPTTVARGWMSLIRSASQVSRSSESSTRSPSLPTSIEPFLFSSKLR